MGPWSRTFSCNILYIYSKRNSARTIDFFSRVNETADEMRKPEKTTRLDCRPLESRKRKRGEKQRGSSKDKRLHLIHTLSRIGEPERKRAALFYEKRCACKWRPYFFLHFPLNLDLSR